jgi:c-di-AMP phosphodiesterase-like protein
MWMILSHGALLLIIVVLLINFRTMRQEYKDCMETVKQRSVQEAADRYQDNELVNMAMPIVKELEGESQAGEWKFHQAYARLTKNMTKNKWKAGLAIHQALAQLRNG